MSLVTAFASPIGADTSAASHAVALKYFERTRLRILVALETKGQKSLIGQAESISMPRGTTWRPEVGLAQTECAKGEVGLAVLQLAAISGATELSVRALVVRPSALAVDGWIVPVRGSTSVEISKGHLSVDSDAGRVDLMSEGGRWTGVTPNYGQFWGVSAIDIGQPRYAIQSRLGFSAGNFPWPTKFPESFRNVQELEPVPYATDALARAMALVSEASPTYMEWIGGVIDGVLLAAGPANYGISSPDFPGLVALSSRGSVMDYAEAVAAEACHQYLFQLLLVSPLTASGTEEIHYVAARRFYLTTRRALVAAHVHANVIRMLRHLQDRPEYADSASLRIARRLLMLETDCMPALKASTQLTEAGHELYSHVLELAASPQLLKGRL